MHINELLTTVVDLGGSDLHLKVGNFPIARVKGRLTPLTQFKKLVQEDTIAMAYSIMASDRQKAKFKESLDIIRSIDMPVRLSEWLFQVAQAYVENDEIDTALLLLQEAYQVAERVGHEKLMKEAMSNIERMCAVQ